MKHMQTPAPAAALTLASQLADEATSPRGIAYEVPLDHAQRQAAQHGIGGEEMRAALDRIRRQRGA
jgi:hypothetical protein